jgi:hypothetical protein
MVNFLPNLSDSNVKTSRIPQSGVLRGEIQGQPTCPLMPESIAMAGGDGCPTVVWPSWHGKIAQFSFELNQLPSLFLLPPLILAG